MNPSTFHHDLAPLLRPDRTWLSLFVDITDTSDIESVTAEAVTVARARGAAESLLTLASDHLRAPIPDGVGGRAVIVSDDGTVHREDGPEGPGVTRAFVDPLPRIGPLLEWRQSIVSHAVVTVAPTLVEIVTFPAAGESEVVELGASVDEAIGRLADSLGDVFDLVVLAGDELGLDRLRRALVDTLPATTDVRMAEPELPLAESTVRHVADVAARRTVAALNEFRFQKTHDAAVEGADAVIDALSRGHGDLLLLHDDPTDERTAWFGPGSSEIATANGPTTPTEGRLVDAVLRMAVHQDKAIRMIPSTGPRGPADDLGLVVRDPTAQL